MSRVHCHIWRRLRRHAKVRLAEIWGVHEDLRIRMIRYRPSRDWSVALCASTDDFPRTRRTRGWRSASAATPASTVPTDPKKGACPCIGECSPTTP